jgi:hypothetical protein
MLESFLYPFLQRVISGLQNMYGYEKNKNLLLGAGWVLALFPLIFFTYSWLYLAYFIVNLFVVYMKTASFKLHPNLTLFKKFQDIHLWENFVTGGIVLYLALANFNILLIICSVYPALILHKGLINIGSKLPFFATATDDETGKTYGIPLLGIKIKRSGNKVRLTLAAISLIAAALIFIFGWNLSIR